MSDRDVAYETEGMDCPGEDMWAEFWARVPRPITQEWRDEAAAWLVKVDAELSNPTEWAQDDCRHCLAEVERVRSFLAEHAELRP